MAEKKTGTGMDPNLAGLLSYLVGWVTGLIFFLIEQENEYVRFHAMQSIIFFGAVSALQILLWILGFIPYLWIVFAVIGWILWVFAFVMWIVFMIKAYQGQRFKFPVTGDLAEKYSKKR